MVMTTLSTKDNRGNKPNEDNKILLEEFNKFYEEHYKNLNYENKINSSYLSQIIGSMATDVLTNVENNIKINVDEHKQLAASMRVRRWRASTPVPSPSVGWSAPTVAPK